MSIHRSKVGAFRAYWLATVVFISAFMQGYDAGVAGGILTFPSFQADLGYGAAAQTQVNSLTVGLQQLGAFLMCPLIYPIADRYGRRIAILLSSGIFVVGAILETINTGSRGAWYTARIIAGFGMGGYTAVTPVFSAEMAPKEIRGRMGSMYQMMYTIGIFTAYWVNYGVQRGFGKVSRQWQLPVGLQIVWGTLLFLGILTLKESTRWLLKRDRPDDAWKSLVWIRGDDSEATRKEFEDMKQGIHEENTARAAFSIKELWEPVNRKRLGIACMLYLFQQGTGSGALASFGPQFFSLLVGPGPTDLLLTGLFGAVKVVACAIFIVFLSERFGRRFIFIGGSIAMFVCMLPTALILHYETPPGGVINAPGIVTIVLLFINIGFYNWSWGPVPWAYTPEIFPTRIRAVCVAIAVSSHWAFSVCFATATPYMIKRLGWGTFLFFAVFDAVNALGSYLFVHETRGKALEKVNDEFIEEIKGLDHHSLNEVDSDEKSIESNQVLAKKASEDLSVTGV